MSSIGLASVDTYAEVLKKLLARAKNVKPTASIEPALVASDFGDTVGNIGKQSDGASVAKSQAHYAAIETACRNIFYDLLVRSFAHASDASLLMIDQGINNYRRIILQRNLEFTRHCFHLVGPR